MHPLDEMRGYFAVDMQSRVIGMTPQQRASDWRYPAIRVSGSAKPGCAANGSGCLQDRRLGSPWIAIDDRDDWFSPDCTNLLATNSQTGFTPDDAIRLERMLRKRMP